jgi:hypothetical protein
MDVIRIAVTAFAIVLGGMLVLTAVCEGLRRLARAAAPAPADPGDRVAVDSRVTAVLAAAVAEVLGPRVRVHRVHVHRGEADRWSRAGRMDVMVSHRVGPTR